ncbi:PadR family transcriptional regulator [Flexivirga sp. B27]
MAPVFAHGQLRLYLLSLLNEGPRHGYEIMRDLEQRFNGLYTPSAGTVYPRLAKLEEEGLVSRSDDGRKATYTITAAGRDEVARRQLDLGDLQSDLDRSASQLAEEVRSRVKGEAADLRAELKAAAREARRVARPAGEPMSGRAGSEFERQINELRSSARKLVRSRRTSEAVRAEALRIVREAQQRIDDLS